MFIERKLNPTTGIIELWKCEWENVKGSPAKKVFKEKYGDEKLIIPKENELFSESPAICWSYGRTLGNIAVYTPEVLGDFAENSGNDAILPCDIVECGKFRIGSSRWWCRTHQSYWGLKADLESLAQNGAMACSNHSQPMYYQKSPYVLDVKEYAEVGIWCSLPAAISTFEIEKRYPKIHVHVRAKAGEKKVIDKDFNAISISYGDDTGLFGDNNLSYVNITPPSAYEFFDALEEDREMDCINCKKCGYPHLDLGDFGTKPHKKHFCGNCGFDSTWSKAPIVSTPLKPLHDHFAKTWKFVDPGNSLNLDDYSNMTYTVWASTPALIWTAGRPQERGIHVHVQNGSERIIDDTFSEVILDGEPLKRGELLDLMTSNTIV